jgi:hypothetical protein
VAWSRVAKRWGELTNPASRTDPALVGSASEVRAAIAAAATNPAGWATPEMNCIEPVPVQFIDVTR